MVPYSHSVVASVKASIPDTPNIPGKDVGSRLDLNVTPTLQASDIPRVSGFLFGHGVVVASWWIAS